ncbi:MAG: DNA starvation/stationary phase protection protein [Alphaproteobacteria bacterium]
MKNEKVIQLLKEAQSGTYVLSLNTQKCHWNVEGINFHSLHLMFDAQYTMLAEDVDVLAERLRALGEYAPGSFKEFEKFSPVDALEKTKLSECEMLQFLVKEYEKLIATLLKLVEESSKSKDDGTADIALGQSEIRQKTLWMLRSSLK